MQKQRQKNNNRRFKIARLKCVIDLVCANEGANALLLAYKIVSCWSGVEGKYTNMQIQITWANRMENATQLCSFALLSKLMYFFFDFYCFSPTHSHLTTFFVYRTRGVRSFRKRCCRSALCRSTQTWIQI